MKSMLEGLDLDGVKVTGRERVALTTNFTETALKCMNRHADNLRTALVAALAVIADINLFVDDETFDVICQQPEFKALETALEPFKVAGDDAKDGAE